MAVSGYDTYYVALRKLVHAYLSTMVRRTRDRRKRSSFCGMYYKMPCSLVIYSIVRGHRQLIGFSIKLWNSASALINFQSFSLQFLINRHSIHCSSQSVLLLTITFCSSSAWQSGRLPWGSGSCRWHPSAAVDLLFTNVWETQEPCQVAGHGRGEVWWPGHPTASPAGHQDTPGSGCLPHCSGTLGGLHSGCALLGMQ